MATFEIYWNDLNDKAKERLNELYHDNIDLSPIAVIVIEDEDCCIIELTETEPKECTFVSIWSDGSKIETPAYLYPGGYVEVVYLSDTEPDGYLEDEYVVINETGEQFKVCLDCHDYIVGSCECESEFAVNEEDVWRVADSVGIKELTSEQIKKVINLYPSEQREDLGATWNLVVEKILYDILG
jgi:hypothetical protein